MEGQNMEPIKFEGIEESIFVEKMHDGDEIVQTYFVEVAGEMIKLSASWNVPTQEALEALGVGLEKEMNAAIAKEIKYELKEMEKNNDNS
tara:strand:- start:1482 stop:1751 length:270 start_codon:yes stop_codon:yes gene_type:complete